MQEQNNAILPVSDEIEVMPHATQIVRAPVQDLMLTPVFDLETAQKRLAELQRFVEFYMVEGEDFGKIPGTPKPTLYKSGADKLCDIYALADTYKLTNRTEDWDRNLFDYEVECTLLSKRTGQLVASGLGSCNSYEGKYRWRETKRKCPQCGKETIIKGKEEYGGGWLCWRKEGKSDGCGAKFTIGDPSIVDQIVGKTQNDDIPTLKNTILKMAKKRAKVDAVLSATRSSGLFTQDMDDIGQAVDAQEQTANPAPPAKQQAPAKESPKEPPNVYLEPGKQGLWTITGEGLAVLLTKLFETEKTLLGLAYDGNFWTVPIANAFRFADACAKHGVGVVHMDSGAARTSAPNGRVHPEPVHREGGAQPSPASPSRIVKNTFPKSGRTNAISAKGNTAAKPAKDWACLEVIWGNEKFLCWDKSLWPYLEEAGRDKSLAILKTAKSFDGKKSPTIEGILRIGETEFEVIEGRSVPVIQR